jgi:hypothetical protein
VRFRYRVLARAFLSLAWLAGSPALPAGAAVNAVQSAGGSNFSWYRVDRPRAGVCDREPYGIVANFNAVGVRTQVESELAEMFQSGQRRLRIGLFFGHGLTSGTLMDSTGGDLSPQNRQNLANFLAAIKAAGFAQVEVAFHPQGPNWAGQWTAWDETMFEENWDLIRNLRPLIQAAGLPYLIDLTNEAIPEPASRANPSQDLLLAYSRRLWANYTSAFGRDDTVGFSVIGDSAHVSRMREVYGDTPPPIFDIHLYGSPAADEYGLFRAADATMGRLDLTQPWIIGEAFYDDAVAAGRLRAAIADTSRPVEYLTEWPLTRGSLCQDVDVPAPTAFDAYEGAGFGTLPPPLSQPVPGLTSRELRTDSQDRVTLGVRCARTFTRCSGIVDLRVGRRAVLRRGFSLLPWQATRLRARLSRALRAALQRAGRLKVTARLTASTQDNGAVTRRTVGAVLVRRAHL